MTALHQRDLNYSHGGLSMIGMLVATSGAERASTVVLFPDAFGLGDTAKVWARHYAALGYVVVVADMWGGRLTPGGPDEIGSLIGSMVGDRGTWHARANATLEAARAQPEVDPESIIAVGYCFGGSTALELLRMGADLRGVVSIHGGLDLLADDWATGTASASVLICTGADDPMATPEQRAALLTGLDAAGLDWEVDVYSNTVHAFTNPALEHSPQPDVFAYNARSAARALRATEHFLAEHLPGRPL